MNKANLLKLAGFLDMLRPGAYSEAGDYSNGDHTSRDSFEICGTVASAVGWAPMVIPVDSWDYDGGCLHWAKYSDRVFGLDEWTDAWTWCFSPQWLPIDDTPDGAAKRIRYLVEHGEPPANWFEQYKGDAPYMFAGGAA